MTDIKTKVQGIEANLKARSIGDIVSETENIYKSLVIISKRSRQLSNDMKNELHNKLEEFATVTDSIEEILENKEQIEISKFYEKLPSPTIIALSEFLGGELEYRDNLEQEQTEEEDND